MKTILIALTLVYSSLAMTAQTIDLFNGSDLNNWEFALKDADKNPSEVFSVKNQMIHIAGPFGYMYSKEKFSNFHLYVEWRWPIEASNSGIFLYMQNTEQVWPDAVECQLQAGNAGDMLLLNAQSGLTKLMNYEGQDASGRLKKMANSSELPVGEWNNAHIICNEGTITIFINGILQNRGKVSYKSGNIAIQSEGKDMQVRKIRLTPLF